MLSAKIAAPRLASTVLLLANSADLGLDHPSATLAKSYMANNDIRVLMVRRHNKAHFMPELYAFPGGGVDVEDGAVASAMGFVSATGDGKLSEAWRSRIAALRELAEETGCVLKGNGAIESLRNWQKSAAGKAAGRCFDATAAPALTPIGRWITPEDSIHRYDTYFYGAAVRVSAADRAASSSLPPQLVELCIQESEISSVVWVSPLEALVRHEEEADAFALPPPTFHLLSALARLSSFDTLASCWEQRGVAAGPPAAAPEEVSFPPVTPGSRSTNNGKDIDFLRVPETCFHNIGADGTLRRGHYTMPTGKRGKRVDLYVGCATESMPAKRITHLRGERDGNSIYKTTA